MSIKAEKDKLLIEKERIEGEYQTLLCEENSLHEQEMEIRQCDMEIEKENEILQKNLKETQDKKKDLFSIQEQLNRDYDVLKPLLDETCHEMEKLR